MKNKLYFSLIGWTLLAGMLWASVGRGFINPSKALAGNFSSQEKSYLSQTQTWQIQTVDESGRFVGRYSSLALDSFDRPHISYTRIDGYWPDFLSNLRYARWTGASWAVQTVIGTGTTGWGVSLALDSNDRPNISYNYWYFRSAIDQLGLLMFIKWTGSAWESSIVSLDESHLSLALDSSGNPFIAHSEYQKISYSRRTETGWQMEDVDTGNLGKYNFLALDSSGNARISYYDEGNGDLKYARWTGASWQAQTVDAAGNVGQFTSLALDSSGNPHISYYDVTNGDLKYARWTGSSWQVQTVDAGGNVGQYTAITLDNSGKPYISYYDVTNGDLKYAAWNGVSWQIQVVDSIGDVGQYTSLKLDRNGLAHISYHDVTNGDLKYARMLPPPPTSTPTATATATPTVTPTPGPMDKFLNLPILLKVDQPPAGGSATPTPTPAATRTATPTSTATKTATPTSTQVASATPTATGSVAPPNCGIGNCDFELGRVIWSEYSYKGWDLIMNLEALPPHSGSWVAWLGGDDDEISYIEQAVFVPADRPYLSYWHWIYSNDVCGYDFAYVRINNNTALQYDLCVDAATNGWENKTINLSAYAGQTVVLQVRVETDDSNSSSLFLDDFAFQSFGN